MYANNEKSAKRILWPIAGAVLFLFFYWMAIIHYPGGSQADKASHGFSWVHNYWCNLLNETAINGAPNAGRLYALAGMLVLCASLCWFWYCFAIYIPLKKTHRVGMQVSAVSSTGIAFFIFTGLHDIIIIIAALCAMLALAGTLLGLYKMKWWGLFAFGIFNLVMVTVNNILYYGGDLLYLPVVQKITFGSFLLWICFISLKQFQSVYNNDVAE